MTRRKLRRARVRFNAARRYWNRVMKPKHREATFGEQSLTRKELSFWGELRT